MRLLRVGSLGYPCNALVCIETEGALALGDGTHRSDDTVARIVDGMTGLLTSV